MRKQFQNLDFGPIIPIGESEFGKAPAFPKAGVHPRLLFTKENIPAIKKALDDPEYKAVRAQIDDLCADSFDGVLGIPYMHGVEGFPGRRGVHNFDARGIVTIEAKAFMYAITGNRELGYQAIDALENFLLTLNIRYIFSDQCREYGQVMTVAAKVYDWCYDLLTEDEKYRIFAGVINYTAAGTCGLAVGMGTEPFKIYGNPNKMEVGYPPREQGCVSGHGSEGQVLRDYFSMAVAVYDEHPEWWEYVAARVYNDYLVQRNYYYKCGCAPQGNPTYAPFRMHYDLYSAYANKVLYGESPYIPELAQAPRSLYCYELPSGQHFSDGDGVHGGYKRAGFTLTTCALWASALSGDATLRAEYKYHRPDYSYSYEGPYSMMPSEFFILVADGLKPADDRHAGLSPVCYNCAPQHKIIARRRWDDETSPAVYMKSGERSTANHEHRDAGSFQLFYKGMLSIDSGHYTLYGTASHANQQSTLAHNGILIKVPELDNGDSYHGSQRKMKETRTNASWLAEEGYRIGIPEGVKYEVQNGVCEYAYLAGNNAPAYDLEREVEYLSRRMLAVFPESEKNPLIFATYDSIVATSESAKKVILLHTQPGPAIEGNTAIAKNDGASLVAQYISPTELDLEYFGGGDDPDMWGRVEISPKLGNLRDDVLSVMYVKDADDADMLNIREIKDADVLGAELMEYALLFVRDLRACPEKITVDTGSATKYMISGLAAGTWSATVGDKTVTVIVGEDELFAKVELPAGKITLEKK